MMRKLLLALFVTFGQALASDTTYLQLADCRGKSVFTSTEARYVLFVEEKFFCSDRATIFKGLIQDFSDPTMAVMEAKVTLFPEGKINLTTMVFIPDLNQTLPLYRFDFEKLKQPGINQADFTTLGEDYSPVTLEYTCTTLGHHMSCEEN